MTKPTKHIYIVMLIDSWFPGEKRKGGTYGGGQVHVRELRRSLQNDYGCKIQLFYSAHPNIIVRTFWSLIVLVRIIQYSRTHKIDLIHSHGYNSGLSGKLASIILKKPVVHTIHGSNLIDRQLNTPKAWLENWLLTKIKYSAQITVSSNFLKHDNVNTAIHVIPNGVEISLFNQVRVSKNPQPTLIWVGRKDPVKGLSVLKEAIKKIRRKIPDLKTELVTGGRLSGKSLVAAYKKAHVFVLPSLAEGQPITLLEAWAAKLPVVVTRVGENPNMVRDGINGYLVDPNNVQQLTQALYRIFKRPKAAVKMGEAGYHLVKQKYTWKKVAKQTHAVYQSLLKSS